jgi:hypothetical protein
LNKLIFILSITLILGIVSISGCTDSGTGNKTYSGEGISFNYPDTWTVENGSITTPNSGMGEIMNVSIKEYASEPPAIPATLNAVAQNVHENITGTHDKKIVTVAGVKGIEYIPTGSNIDRQRVDIFFAKGDNFYDIFITTNDYESDKSGFEMIIKTLKFN